MEASSSEMPPLRKVTPGMTPGTQRSSVRTVVCAISVGSLLSSASIPGTTMAGLRIEPSRKTPFSWIFL